MEKQVEYANFYLQKGALVYDKVKEIPVIKSQINRLLFKKDQAGLEATLSFKELLNILKNNRAEKGISIKDISELEESISAFDGILRNEKVIPQFYFPFIFSNKTNNTFQRSATDETLYVYSTDPDEPSSVPSYKVEGDQLVPTGEMLDEQNAQQRNVVVLGFDENNDGYTVGNALDTLTVDTTNNPNINYYTSGYGRVAIKEIAVELLKEAWYKGKADVHYDGVVIYFDGNVVGPNFNKSGSYGANPIAMYEEYGLYYFKDSLSISRTGPYRGVLYAKIKKSDVRDHVVYNSSNNSEVKNSLIKERFFMAAGNLGYGSPPYSIYGGDFSTPTHVYNSYLEAVQLWIFEYDTWPVGRKNVDIVKPYRYLMGLTNNKLGREYYRSSDEYYAAYLIFNAPYTKLRGNNIYLVYNPRYVRLAGGSGMNTFSLKGQWDYFTQY